MCYFQLFFHFKIKNMQQNINKKDDLERRSLDTMCVNESMLEHRWYHNLKYLLLGIFFGIVFTKAEVISWFRIQEMFRLQSFHMYGIIGSSILVAMISIWLIKKFNILVLSVCPWKYLPINMWTNGG